ncbi:MAG: FtsX-like permease family protein [Bellilinea sp.]
MSRTPPGRVIKTVFPRSLVRLGWRYVVGHAWQSFLMVLGIALGVAVMVSIDLANASASRAFSLSAEAVTGKATHQIVSASGAVDETVYTNLRLSGKVELVAPVITALVSSEVLGGAPLQLLGIDPFADSPFRGYLGSGNELDTGILTPFLTRAGAVLLSAELAARSGLAPGDSFPLNFEGRTREVYLAGTLSTVDALTRRTLNGVVLADIATAQDLTEKTGQLDRIDLILSEDDPGAAAALQADLPAGVRLEAVEARQGSIEQMTAAFQLNLTALSMLALVVGLFLIYNTMTFSVVRRRGLFGTLRSLGVTRREVFNLVISEALLVGVAGSLLGVGLGILLGRNAVSMVSQTINDLYFTTTVRAVGLPVSSLVKGGVIGVLATLATAVPPAVEAALVEPRAAQLRSGLEKKTQLITWLMGLAGLILAGSGVLLFQIPAKNNIPGLAGTVMVVIGFAMLSAIAMRGLLTAVTPLTGRLFGSLGRMAPRNLVNTLSRTAVAVAALMVAVAVTIGVTLMIDSFRFTVNVWLEQTLQSDVYISAPSFTANTSTIPIDPRVVDQVAAWPGLVRADRLRSTVIESPGGPVKLSATTNPDIGKERLFKAASGTPDEIMQELREGSVLLSEPLANRLDLSVGDSISLYTPEGERNFPVAGIFYDYASSQGSLLIWMEHYRQIWGDTAVTSIGLRLPSGSDPDRVVGDLQSGLQTDQQLIIRPNKSLRQDVMEVFERTFAITAALRILATIVAFIGVLSTLLLLQLEKQREIGVLKALGLTGKQLWQLVMLETGLMGLTAGILAVPTGVALSLILIYVINLRSFGWTLQFDMRPGAFAMGLLIAVSAALLAGVLPAWRLSRMEAAEAIRYE